ncbi:hypothetical protein TPE_0069 [Treponema pedis str. T A4]|uniref:Uncharacterized protein n=1 Tax=Treponema pedis str. T A4 TaxID=1291379 RepID=S5ZJ77_9SPIR|nr:hypothetical protein TPE_0069 [Treponema pedis str. T A4]
MPCYKKFHIKRIIQVLTVKNKNLNVITAGALFLITFFSLSLRVD